MRVVTLIELCRRMRYTVAASAPIVNNNVAHEAHGSCSRSGPSARLPHQLSESAMNEPALEFLSAT
ncbi:hypothetical protein [Nocardia sp. NPDC047648]|uniref:hypothetical protein n=1 Tax=Nocardia sp. NPDC047648 TaxID=3155625 RepID=UPI0033F7AB68